MRLIATNERQGIIRPYYEICDAGTACAPVKLLAEIGRLGKPRHADFRITYGNYVFDKLKKMDLLRIENGDCVLAGDALQIFDKETVRIWNDLKEWKYRRKFFG
ncbi:MAG: hypothetical protein V1887_00125 [Candidatus Aenigmatarchaeota archaeon]